MITRRLSKKSKKKQRQQERTGIMNPKKKERIKMWGRYKSEGELYIKNKEKTL